MKILELKNITRKIKSSMDRLKSRVRETGESVNWNETTAITQPKQ